MYACMYMYTFVLIEVVARLRQIREQPGGREGTKRAQLNGLIAEWKLSGKSFQSIYFEENCNFR